MLRRLILATAAFVAAVVAYAAVTAPQKHAEFSVPLDRTVMFGAYHIHTTNSDGQLSPAEVAAAAHAAGLSFAILTDHGDATRVPAPPRYVDGVLLIDAVEISSVEGHIVALGLQTAAPYRLGGEARDVIDDVHRLGGFAIVAHPDSPRADLRWRPSGAGGRGAGPAGTDISNADGLEWLNADSERRDDKWWRVLQAAITLPIRPGESFVELFRRPAATFRRWDALTRRRPVIGLAATDAHGVRGYLYKEVFLSLAQAVRVSQAPRGDAAADAVLLLDGLRAGHTWSVITGIGSAVSAELSVTDATGRIATMGERLSTGADISVAGKIPGASQARLALMHDDREIAFGRGEVRFSGPAAPGAYRLEATLDRNDHMPWVVSNPVYVFPPAPARELPVAPAEIRDEFTAVLPAATGWVVEHGPSSSGTVTTNGDAVMFGYHVGTERPGLEYGAVVHDAAGSPQSAESFDRLEFVASADKPMRVSVQVRLPGGERWARSIYLSPTPQPITVRLSELMPVGFSTTRRPVVIKVKSILFVVDTLNSVPGTDGTITLSSVTVKRARQDRSGSDLEQQVGRPGQEQQVGRPGREGRRQ